MPYLPKHFARLDRELRLNRSRAQRINQAIQSVATFIAQDGPLQAYVVGEPVLQGSFATDTVVRPIGADAGYDVDLLIPMDLSAFPDGIIDPKRTPEYILSYLQRRLRTNYAVRLEKKSRCIRMNYAGDFHIDLVPAHVVKDLHGPFQIGDRQTGDFLNTDPLAFVQWVRGLDAAFDGRFTRAVRAMKRWRDRRFGKRTAPSSMHLTILAGRALEHFAEKRDPPFTWLSDESDSMEATLWDLSCSMRHYLDTGFFGFKLRMPGAVHEDIARSWPEEHHALFRTRLDTFISRAQKAIVAKRTDTAVRRWQENLGPAFVKTP